MLLFDKASGQIVDTRCDDIILSDKISISYTLPSDDITTQKRVSCTPYVSRQDGIDFEKGTSADLGAEFTVRELHGGLFFDAKCNSEVSESGVNLPFNFMGKLGGGSFDKQFLFNSVYSSPDKSIIYAYLTKPNGNNLVVAILSRADGWKMDYSPYLWGHFFVNLKLLARYDRAYHSSNNEPKISFGIFPVSDFSSCLSVLSEVYDLPFIDYSVGGGKIGDTISLSLFGSCDYISDQNGTRVQNEYTISSTRESILTPYKDGKAGASVTVYGYESLEALYKSAMDTVSIQTLRTYTDFNLCEHQCWVSAMLRFLLRYKSMLTPSEVKEYESKVLYLLDIITQQDQSKAEPRVTIWHKEHNGFNAYNVYESKRVQELFFGITILLDAYKYFGDEKYYTYLTGAMNCLIDYYGHDDGSIRIDWGNHYEDYTTVCCAMIPICDVASFTSKRDFALSQKCLDFASKMANYLYIRGLHFPTEGGETNLAGEEMEDGSISCTALALLYYSNNICRKQEYIDKALEILDLHDSWVIKTPICQMHGSSLRWWETQWEGDADGPAICAGHAWSIWRAEADYLAYVLTGEAKYLTKAQNGFMTNLSKIDKNGNMYAIYCPDEITGGGLYEKKPKHTLAPRFASVPDSGMSRYVFIRINDTLLK
jgi:hypothetical protein